MKQNQLSTAFNLIACVFMLMLVSVSCNKKSAEFKLASDTDEIASAKPATIQTVSLKVTMNDAAGNNLTSDGGGDYVTGSQSVSATFDQYGNFIFTCGLGGHGNNTYLIRWMNINFNQPIQVFINPPVTGNDKVTGITTGFVAAYTFIPLQNLAVGQSECVGLTGGSNANWVMNFHREAEDISSSPSSYAVFTRISLTQWTISSAGSCSPNPNVCSLRNGPGTLYGYYTMPFNLTLTKL
ncbi:MAG: hypothetical protein ACHQEB_07020 [Chitinophagales bacterium]